MKRLLFLLLLLSALPAFAAKKNPVDLTRDGVFSFFRKNGSTLGIDSAQQNTLYDVDPETGAANLETGISVSESGAWFLFDLSGITNASLPAVYMDEITIGHSENRRYSLYVSEDKTTWIPVVSNVTTTGETVYPVKDRYLAVRYVIEKGENINTLCDFHVTGYQSSKPHVVSKKTLAWIYKPDGTAVAPDSSFPDCPHCFGGGSVMSWLFNNNFTDGVYIGPNGLLANGGYCMLDFSSEKPGGWFVTEIKTGSLSTKQYSLSYSMDGTTWKPVKDADHVEHIGQKSFLVNDTAVYVKCVFDQVGGWTASFNEFQVWGMEAEDVFCTHPSYTEWSAVEGSATCLEPGMDEQFCSICGKRFTRKQAVGLGHDFVSHLLVPGAYRKFGSGYIDCSRCDWRLDFPLSPVSMWDTQPLDLVTNRVNGTQIGRVSVMGQFNFTEITVTSTGNGPDEPDPTQNYGVSPVAMIDNNWTMDWQKHWYSIRASIDPDPHVDYVFGTEIDLAWIDVSTDNANYTNLFFSVNDATGEETLLASSWAFTADETHQEEVEAISFTPVYFSPTSDAEPVAGKTYYSLEVVGEGANERAQWTPVSGLEAFEEGTMYFEPSATGAAWCTKNGDNYVQIPTPSVFTSDVDYYVQSATTDGDYYTESSGQYVSAGKLTTFAVGTTYYRTTGVTTGNNLVTILDAPHAEATRVQIRFYGQPVKHLRLRQVKPDGSVRAPMKVSELRPWGTVKGAGDLMYHKETLMILR